MSHLIKAGCAIGALIAPTLPAAAADVGIPANSEHHQSITLPTPGKATPAEVKASMRELGMSILDTPVTSLLSGADRVAATESSAAMWCNGNYCISTKPDFQRSTSVHSAEGMLERARQNGHATVASLLDEMDKVVKPGQPWSLTQAGSHQFVLG